MLEDYGRMREMLLDAYSEICKIKYQPNPYELGQAVDGALRSLTEARVSATQIQARISLLEEQLEGDRMEKIARDQVERVISEEGSLRLHIASQVQHHRPELSGLPKK